MACQLLPHFKQNNMTVLSPLYRYIFTSKTRRESGSKITYVVGWKDTYMHIKYIFSSSLSCIGMSLTENLTSMFPEFLKNIFHAMPRKTLPYYGIGQIVEIGFSKLTF